MFGRELKAAQLVISQKLINKLVFTGNDGVMVIKPGKVMALLMEQKLQTVLQIPVMATMQELVETDNNIFASIRETSIGRELWVVNYSSILPLDFLEFKGRLEKNDAILNWKTENEINTEEFVVERSVDGNNYTRSRKC